MTNNSIYKPEKKACDVKRFLRLPEVCRLVALSKSHIYNLISQGRFPKPIKLGQRASGWLDSEIQCWINQRVIDSRAEVSND